MEFQFPESVKASHSEIAQIKRGGSGTADGAGGFGETNKVIEVVDAAGLYVIRKAGGQK